MEHIELLQKLLVVLFTVAFFWKLITYMWSFLNVEKEPVIVLVTGAAGMLKPIFFFPSRFLQRKNFISYHGFECLQPNYSIYCHCPKPILVIS